MKKLEKEWREALLEAIRPTNVYELFTKILCFMAIIFQDYFGYYGLSLLLILTKKIVIHPRSKRKRKRKK